MISKAWPKLRPGVVLRVKRERTEAKRARREHLLAALRERSAVARFHGEADPWGAVLASHFCGWAREAVQG